MRCAAVSLLAILASLLAGCSNRIIPPAQPDDPVAVYLLDHGKHSSLLLPAARGRFVRYAYGDWKWYALGRTGALDGMAALFWPTRATLGRGEVVGPDAVDQARRQEPEENTYALLVSRQKVDALRAELDAAYEEGLPTLHVSGFGLGFVHHSSTYTLLSNCNHVTKTWVKKLGCRVHGSGVLSIWEVSNP